jgi:hypothetical protein
MSRTAALLALVAVALLGACAQEATESTGADTTAPPSVVTASDIPVANTPPGGWSDVVPEPVLSRCTEPLVDGAPDMRGLWRAVSAQRDGAAVPEGDRALTNVQRIEQCGDRVTITAGGIIHDMRADGTLENGVDDVAERDFTTPIRVVATFESGVHVLRPEGFDLEVTRRIDDGQLVWDYLGTQVTLERIGGPDDPFPPTATG